MHKCRFSLRIGDNDQNECNSYHKVKIHVSKSYIKIKITVTGFVLETQTLTLRKEVIKNEHIIIILVSDCLGFYLDKVIFVHCCKGLVELLWLKDEYKSLLNGVQLMKCLKARLWEDSRYVSKQLDGIGICDNITA